MQVRATLAVTALAMLVPGTAEAHVPKKCSTKLKLPELAKCQRHNLQHSIGVVKFARARGIYNKEARWHHKAYAWQRREYRQTRRKLRPPIRHYSAWLCIHRYEGAWNANTGNGYYGGLQMDYDFMSTYGKSLLRRKGTANNWTPYEQMLVAERAHRTRGFHPWPRTARKCGLL
jgi:Transglycosylase-like domain